MTAVIFEVKLLSEIMKGAWIDGRNVKSNYYSLLPIKHLLPQIWKLGLQNKEISDTLNEFKNKVKSWYPDRSTCRLCKLYIGQFCFTGSIHASFSGRISLCVFDSKVYSQYLTIIPVKIYLFKVNNIKIRKRSKICSKLTIKALTTSRQIFPRMLSYTFLHIS